MIQLKALFIGLLMMTVSACTAVSVGDGQVPLGPLSQRVADAIIDVSNENRDLRVCWMAAGAVEVITDLAQRAGGPEAGRAFGHLMLLQGAIDKSRMSDSFWIETDTADVALLFAGVLKDLGKTRLSQILLGGPTLSNFLNVAKRTVVLTVKGRAVMRDINRVLQGVEDRTIDKVAAWKACEDRTEMNRDTLRVLTGGLMSLSTEILAPTLVEYDIIKPDGFDGDGGNAGAGPSYPDGWLRGGGWGTETVDWILTPRVDGGAGDVIDGGGGGTEIILASKSRCKFASLLVYPKPDPLARPLDGDINGGDWDVNADWPSGGHGVILAGVAPVIGGWPIDLSGGSDYIPTWKPIA